MLALKVLPSILPVESKRTKRFMGVRKHQFLSGFSNLFGMPSENILNVAEDLIAVFNLDRNQYFEFVPLRDVQLGFSVKRKYPEKIGSFLKAQSKKKIEPNCVFWITARKREGSRLYEIDINVNSFFGNSSSTDTQLHRIGDKDKKPSLYLPLELSIDKEFNYDPEFGSLGKASVQKTGNEILEEIFNKHTLPFHFFRGFFLRRKLWIRNFAWTGIDAIILILNFLMEHICGRKFSKSSDQLEESIFESIYNSRFWHFQKQDIVRVSQEDIKAFNYSTTKTA
jgi:hypothetical protein